jgi:UDP-perosamine 4-acetyltransferase
MSAARIVGIGAGGHARSVLDAVQAMGGWDVVALVDADRAQWGHTVLGVEVVGDDTRLSDLLNSGVRHAFIGIGGVRDNAPRAAAYAKARELGFELPVIQHPAAIVASSAHLGEGTVVLAGAVVNPEARIGVNVIVNTRAVVEHDCSLDEHCHLATGATLGGAVKVGAGAHIGIGAVVLQGLTIGDRAVVGGGAVVIEDVAAGTVVVGSPARPIKQDA